MPAVSFVVDREPVPQPRPRFRVSRKRTGQAYPQAYTPRDDPVQAWKEAVNLQARLASPGNRSGWPATGAVDVDCLFVLPRPRGGQVGGQHTAKPDTDNLVKAVLDALKAVLWVDDCQVSSLHARKVWAKPGEKPHARIRVEQHQ